MKQQKADLFCRYCKPKDNMKGQEQRKCRLKLAALPFVVSAYTETDVGMANILIKRNNCCLSYIACFY